ncbi:MAG TPA: hypothetical protein VJ327_03300 [Patescibacteria group bacterium]|nr:hypothetical protein [Patescibacteria group bacterium]
MWSELSIGVGILLIAGYYVLEYRAQKDTKNIILFAWAIRFRTEIFVASGLLILGGIGYLLYERRGF